MVIVGIDAHKRTHTAVAIDGRGRELGSKTTKTTTTAAHLELVRWAERFGPEREWAVEDCRHLSRRLEADLLAAGERIRRVPPKLMAKARDSARTYGKSDPIDALAVARAALREPDLPVAQLDGPARELRLLVDHREDLVKDRTGHINRLRWHLHELDPTWDPPARSITSYRSLKALADRLNALDGMVARIAVDLVERIRSLTVVERALQREITQRVTGLAPGLLALVGVGPLVAAKIIGEVADVRRFKHKDAFARHNGTAPLPAWSGNPNRPPLAHGQPAIQRSYPPHRDHPALPPPRRPHLPRPARRHRRHPHRSTIDTALVRPCAPTRAGGHSPESKLRRELLAVEPVLARRVEVELGEAIRHTLDADRCRRVHDGADRGLVIG